MDNVIKFMMFSKDIQVVAVLSIPEAYLRSSVVLSYSFSV